MYISRKELKREMESLFLLVATVSELANVKQWLTCRIEKPRFTADLLKRASE